MKKKHSFYRGMAAYAIVFLAVVLVAVVLQWNWLAAYEHTRSDYVIEDYIGKLTAKKARGDSLDSFDWLDTNILSAEDAFDRYAAPYFSGNLSYKKDTSQSGTDRERYVIFSDDTEIGSVILEQMEEREFQLSLFGTELKKWQATEQSFDFSFLKSGKTASVTLPMEYYVECNGYRLGTRYITSKNNHYDSLEYLTELGIELPYMATYTVSNFLGDVEFVIYDPEGNVAAPDVSYETLLINNCTEEEMTRLTGFLEKYCRYYVAFMGSPRYDIYLNFNNLKPYLLAGSELESRLRGALDGMTWSNNKSNEIKEMTVNYCINLGDGKYVADLTYKARTLGAQQQYVTTGNYYRVFMEWNDKGVYAYEMTASKNAEVLDGE